jgi:hypothetical protein
MQLYGVYGILATPIYGSDRSGTIYGRVPSFLNVSHQLRFEDISCMPQQHRFAHPSHAAKRTLKNGAMQARGMGRALRTLRCFSYFTALRLVSSPSRGRLGAHRRSISACGLYRQLRCGCIRGLSQTRKGNRSRTNFQP